MIFALSEPEQRKLPADGDAFCGETLLLPVALLAIAFGLVLSKGGRSAVRL